MLTGLICAAATNAESRHLYGPGASVVLDFSPSCHEQDGCLDLRPRTWQPDRLPEEGVAAKFLDTSWKGWGKGVATGTASAVVCPDQGTAWHGWNGSNCVHKHVSLVVYDTAFTGNGVHQYRCLSVRHWRGNGLIGVIDVSGADLFGGETHCPAAPQ